MLLGSNPSRKKRTVRVNLAVDSSILELDEEARRRRSREVLRCRGEERKAGEWVKRFRDLFWHISTTTRSHGWIKWKEKESESEKFKEERER